MKNNILVFLMMFLCLQISAQQRRKNIPQRRTTASVKKGTPQTLKKMREVGEDGFIWYKLQKGNLYGAADIEGRTIIPIKFTSVYYLAIETSGAHYFCVKSGDFEAVFTRCGRCIISPSKHFTNTSVRSCKTDKGKILLSVSCENNFGEKSLYDIRGNEVIPSGNYEHLFITSIEDGLAHIKCERNGLKGAFDLNGNLLTKPVANSYLRVYDNKIEVVNKNSSGNYEKRYIYGSYSEDTRFDYNNYDGIYRPFKAIKSSSSSSSSSRTNSSETTSSIDSKKGETSDFPLVASRKYKIKSTFMGEESHEFSGEGYVEYKGNKIIINLGFTTKEYTLNQPPKPLLGVLGMIFGAMDVVCDGEKGKLSIVESQSTISIEPIGFSMNLGYVVEK